jgi:hypothetical protein
LRRRCSAYRRRQNLYAKNTEGLQRAVTVQRLVHNRQYDLFFNNLAR